jgi:hypothetical protein
MTTISAIQQCAQPGESKAWGFARQLVTKMFGRQPQRFEREVAHYLERHCYDLPPQVWIELQRRHSGF